MNLEEYIRILKTHVEAQELDFGDGESVLTLLYEAYNEVNSMDDAKIKADFHKLYELMNGMPLRDMDKIIYPVYTLCRDHEKSGFIHGTLIFPFPALFSKSRAFLYQQIT